jgi:hypothetical protein
VLTDKLKVLEVQFQFSLCLDGLRFYKRPFGSERIRCRSPFACNDASQVNDLVQNHAVGQVVQRHGLQIRDQFGLCEWVVVSPDLLQSGDEIFRLASPDEELWYP